MPRSDENRFSKDKDSFYYLAIKNNKSRPKADKKPTCDETRASGCGKLLAVF